LRNPHLLHNLHPLHALPTRIGDDGGHVAPAWNGGAGASLAGCEERIGCQSLRPNQWGCSGCHGTLWQLQL
jgi:hypothetical protein